MADLFSNADPSAPGLFSEVNTTQPTNGTNLAPEAVNRQAGVAALANLPSAPTPEDLMTQYSQLTKQYGDFINQGLGDHLKSQAASEQQVSDLQSLSRLQQNTNDPQMQQMANAAVNAAIANTTENRAKTAIEVAAAKRVQTLAQSGDSTQAHLVEMNINQGDAEQVMHTWMSKQLILQSALENAQVTQADQPWFRDAADWVLSMIPFKGSLARGGVVPVDGALKNWYDGIWSGQRVQRETDSLWNLPLDQFSDMVNNHVVPSIKDRSSVFGYNNHSAELSTLSYLSGHPTAWQINAGDTLDNLGWLPVTKGAKLLTIPSLLIRSGAREEARQLVAGAFTDMIANGGAAAEAKTGMTTGQVIDNLLPSAVNPNVAPTLLRGKVFNPSLDSKLMGGVSSAPLSTEGVRLPDLSPLHVPAMNSGGTAVPIAADASAAAARGRMLLANLTDLAGTSRFMTDAERTEAYSKFLKDLKTTEYPGRVKDVETATVPLAGNASAVTQVTLTLGKKGGGGFIDENAANTFLGSIGRSGTVVQDESGQWFARVTHTMPENGMYNLKLEPQSTNIFSRFLKSSRSTSDIPLANQAQRAGNQLTQVMKGVMNGYQKTFRALNPGERERLGMVLGVGQDQSQWLTEDQLGQLFDRVWSRAPSDRELDAYRSAIDLNDIGYAIRNDELWKFNALKGYQTISFDTGMGQVNRRNALVSAEAPTGMQRWYDVAKTQHMMKDALTEELRNLNAGLGRRWVTLAEPLQMADGTTIRHFLMDRADMHLEDLRTDQLPYKPGLNRIYKPGQYFAKQAQMGFQPDTKAKFLKSPGTFMAGTKAEVDFWTGRMNAAREYYLGGKSGADIDRDIFQGHNGFETGDEFIKNMEAGVYDKDHEFGTYYDREMPKEYNDANDMSMLDTDESGTIEWLRTNGRLYYSPRGDRLPDWNGADADVLDPWKTLNQSLMNVASISSFSDYKLSSIERWVNSFRPFLNTKTLPDGASDYQIFRDGSIRGDIPNSVRQGIEAQRDSIKRVLGWKTEQDYQARSFARNLTDWIEGNEPGTWRHNTAETLVDWWSNKNPVMALKGAAFDLKLGLFNVSQFPLQLSTAWNAIMLDPVNGMKGFGMIPFLRAYMTNAGTDNMLDLLVKRGVHGIGGFDSADEFKAFMKMSKQSGFLNVGGAHEFSVDYGANFGMSDHIQQLREAGRFFFQEPEVWNRIVAQRIAWNDAMKATGGKWLSDQFKDLFAGRAEDYAFGMSKQSGAAWQRGIASIPTQFWAYNARMLEAMLPSALGGSKAFTAAQKTRLIIGQSLLYGSAGFPMAGVISDLIKRNTGASPSLDSFGGLADRGLLDEAIYHLTGADVQVGRRYGTGNFLSDTVKDLMGWSSFGEKSVADVAGGASLSTVTDTAMSLINVAHYAAMESGDDSKPLTQDALRGVAMQVSSYSNALKAMMIARYGEYISNRGTVISSDLPSRDAWAIMLFGAQPGQNDDLSSKMEHLQDRKAAVDDAVKHISAMRQRWANEPDNRVDIEQQINTFTRLLDPNIKTDVLRKAHGRTDKSVYDSVARQIQREHAQDTVQEGLEQ